MSLNAFKLKLKCISSDNDEHRPAVAVAFLSSWRRNTSVKYVTDSQVSMKNNLISLYNDYKYDYSSV